jgi:hypothetical protein
MYKIIRILPYLILVILSYAFWQGSIHSSDFYIKNLFLNLASSSLFVVIAYLFYDLIKIFIEKKESRFIDDYIKNQISNDVFAVLYSLKKYLHGYNLDTNSLSNILSISSYKKDKIKTLLANQTYLGFQIFKDTEDLKNLFHSAIQNHLIAKYSPRYYIINMLKISSLLNSIEYFFRNEMNFTESAEKAIDYTFIRGKELNPENEQNRYLLLRKTPHPNRAVVYDSGCFEEKTDELLLNKFTIKNEMVNELSAKIYHLIKLLSFWIPNKYQLTKLSDIHRIIKNYYSQYLNASTIKTRIYDADIVEVKQK